MAKRNGGTPPATSTQRKPVAWAKLEVRKSVPNTSQLEVVPVNVSIQNATLDEVVRFTIEQMERELMLTGAGANSNFSVTEDELKRYFATAIFTRISWVNKERNTIGTRPDGMRREWALPDTFASIINAIGRFDDRERGLSYIPVWNEDQDNLLLTLEECQRIASKMRALEGLIHLVDAFEKRTEGLEEVMTLLSVEMPDGSVHFMADTEFTTIDVITGMVLGFNENTSIRAVDIPPQLRKKSTFSVEAAKPDVFSYCTLKAA